MWSTHSRSSRSERSSSRGNCRHVTTTSIYCRSSATKLRYCCFVSLLNAHCCLSEWSKESLLQSWIDDPIRCCEISGVNPPLSILHERGLTTIDITHFDTVHLSKEVPCCPSAVSLLPLCNLQCGICLKEFESGSERIVISCDHQFCKECWQ